MRQIVLDTETTGFDAEGADRIIEIGAVEIFNNLPTGRTYHQYINPERDVPEDAVAVHGLTTEFLQDKPVFASIVEDFLNFIADSELVIHNAEFDMKFINAELKRLGMPVLPTKRALDTLLMARERFPGSPANLDALCRRFSIDNTNRTLHGALLDSELLAEVYLELMGGRQHGLGLDAKNKASVSEEQENQMVKITRKKREPRVFSPTKEEIEKHTAFVAEKFEESLWNKET